MLSLYDQLNAVLPDATNDPEQLDQILGMLETRGVELVEELAVDNVLDTSTETGTEAEAVNESDDEAAPNIYEGNNPKVGEDEFSDKIDDPVRMYLSQMGEIPTAHP